MSNVKPSNFLACAWNDAEAKLDEFISLGQLRALLLLCENFEDTATVDFRLDTHRTEGYLVVEDDAE